LVTERNLPAPVSQRIVSLLASGTEIVHALGCGERLVGRSHECDFPAAVRALPVCTEALIDATQSSAAIDRQVKTAARDALSIYRVDRELLRALQPDVIITQTQCEVCAVSLRDVEAAICDLLEQPARIVSLEPHAIADIWRDIARVAVALGLPDRGAATIGELRARRDALAAQTSGWPAPTVACIEWIDPLMAAGNWTPELIAIAGGRSVAGEAGAHSPWLTPEQLRALDPEVIVIAPCGFDLPRTRAELPALTGQPWWPTLRAVRDARVYLADGNAYFNRSGPRLVETAELLAEMIHPGCCDFGHQGAGWEHLETQ
jgi:iron complex transport system substrate-binding protein